MIETLVSILVLSCGALAAISMQLVALTTTQQSTYQTRAIQLAGELADKIRMYSESSTSNLKSEFFQKLNDSVQNVQDISAAKNCYSEHEPCSAEEMMQFEMNEITARIGRTLPSARLQICRDLSSSNENGAAIDWSCAGGGSIDAPLVIKLGWNGKMDDRSDASPVGGASPKLVLNVAADSN